MYQRGHRKGLQLYWFQTGLQKPLKMLLLKCRTDLLPLRVE
jgi:hypothetical protein